VRAACDPLHQCRQLSSHVLGDCAGTNSEAKRGEFGLNTLLTPERIFASHPPNQVPQVGGDSLPAALPT
jgi:hypothetical protein